MFKMADSSSDLGRFRQNCQRRERRRSRQVLTAILVSHLPGSSKFFDSGRLSACQALRNVSWVAESASSASWSMRRQSRNTRRCSETIHAPNSRVSETASRLASRLSAIAPITCVDETPPIWLTGTISAEIVQEQRLLRGKLVQENDQPAWALFRAAANCVVFPDAAACSRSRDTTALLSSDSDLVLKTEQPLAMCCRSPVSSSTTISCSTQFDRGMLRK